MYVTKQNDTWDSIAFLLYGTEAAMESLMKANLPLLDIVVFPAGIEMNTPEVVEIEEEELPEWRMDDGEP